MSACRLCESALVDAGRVILFRTNSVFAILSKDPRAEFHALVIPTRHIDQSEVLQNPQLHAELLAEMIHSGEKICVQNGWQVSQSRLMFHRPPFHSQRHLHMHVLGGTFVNLYRDIAHRTRFPWAITAYDLLYTEKK